MSPDSPIQSRQRRAWRAMSAAGCVLGATGILLNAVGGQRADQQQVRVQKTVCAIKSYSEETLASLPRNPNASPDAVKRFQDLVRKMRATGIDCPK